MNDFLSGRFDGKRVRIHFPDVEPGSPDFIISVGDKRVKIFLNDMQPRIVRQLPPAPLVKKRSVEDFRPFLVQLVLHGII